MSEEKTRDRREYSFSKEHQSINYFQTFSLPSLTVLTGENGAGKTHFLNAVKSGAVKVSGIGVNDIVLFSMQSFRTHIPKAQPNSAHMLPMYGHWKAGESWDLLVGKNFFQDAEAIYQKMEKTFPNSNFDLGDLSSSETQTYFSEIAGLVSRIFPQKMPPDALLPVRDDVLAAMKKCRKFVHLVSEEEYKAFVQPAMTPDRYLHPWLSERFTSYRKNQMRWVESQFSNGSTIGITALTEEYEKKFTPPWVTVNEIFSKVRRIYGKPKLFNFSVTAPTEYPKFSNIEG